MGFRRRVCVDTRVVGGRSFAGWLWPATACEEMHEVARPRSSGVGGATPMLVCGVCYSVCYAPLPVCFVGVVVVLAVYLRVHAGCSAHGRTLCGPGAAAWPLDRNACVNPRIP